MKDSDAMKGSPPFLKWPGGKRWFVTNYDELLPEKYGTYIEPFLGSGAVFFSLCPKKAILTDVNRDLIATYQGIQEDWRKVLRSLRVHQRGHDADYYYRIRDSQPRSTASAAARLIYLNRTCFNGIYRVNRFGKFNVPKGSRNTVLFDSDNFGAIARALANAKLMATDFEVAIDMAKKGDLVFADPPYTVRHNNNGFIKYNEKLFSWDDQIRLADALERAVDRGAKVVSTNGHHHSLRKLYRDRGFKLRTVSRASCISAAPESRRSFDELVILSN